MGRILTTAFVLLLACQARWRSFLVAYGERELDSATQARLISIAKYELMRIYYLPGDLKVRDKLLSELDPLQLIKTPKTSSTVL
jgi:hypothetical protein